MRPREHLAGALYALRLLIYVVLQPARHHLFKENPR